MRLLTRFTGPQPPPPPNMEHGQQLLKRVIRSPPLLSVSRWIWQVAHHQHHQADILLLLRLGKAISSSNRSIDLLYFPFASTLRLVEITMIINLMCICNSSIILLIRSSSSRAHRPTYLPIRGP